MDNTDGKKTKKKSKSNHVTASNPNALNATLLATDQAPSSLSKASTSHKSHRKAPGTHSDYTDFGPQSDSLYKASLVSGTLIKPTAPPSPSSATNSTVNSEYRETFSPLPVAKPVASGYGAPQTHTMDRGELDNPVAAHEDAPVETEAQRLAREKKERDRNKESCCSSCCSGSSSSNNNTFFLIYMGPGPAQNNNAHNNNSAGCCCCLTDCCPPRPSTCCPTFGDVTPGENIGGSCCCFPCNVISQCASALSNGLCGESGLLNGGCLKDCCPERPTVCCFEVDCGRALENIGACCFSPCDLLGSAIGASGELCNLFGGCISGCCEGLSQIDCSGCDCDCPN